MLMLWYYVSILFLKFYSYSVFKWFVGMEGDEVNWDRVLVVIMIGSWVGCVNVGFGKKEERLIM